MGSYRAFKFGEGRRRYLGLVPIGLILLGGVVCPFIFGVLKGANAMPTVGGIGGDELMILAITGPLLLAVVSGATLSLVFRPRVGRQPQ
jgi:hypothetical protein